ncbi:MAG: CocE/NonD family hydrolase [Hyphomicrobiales bacterium]
MTLLAKNETLDSAIACGVETVMRDGTVLISDLWGTDLQNPKPVILERTPYGRLNTDQAERSADQSEPARRGVVAQSYVDAGFVYCVQDCRGTGDSGGTFDKYVQESQDTTDTIAWLRQQPWCDGSVLMVGFSYGAACQLAAIVTDGQTPDAAILDCGGFSSALTSGIRQGGALALKQATWSHAQALRDARARGDHTSVERLSSQDVLDWLRRGPWVEAQTPLADFPEHQSNLSAMWQQSIDGPYWDRPGLRSPAARLATSTTRVMFVTSWFDTSLRATLENYAAMTAPDATCPQPELIIGPWSHGDRWSNTVGEVDVGLHALPEKGLGASFQAIREGFLQKVIAGDETPAVASPENARVHYFELGSAAPQPSNTSTIAFGGRWRHAASWPPIDARPYELFLADQSLAAHLGAPSTATFCSDPDDPVPNLGGAINSGGDIMPGGMFDQSQLDKRQDVVRFQTPLFQNAISFAGLIVAHIWVSSSAPDFDLACKLVLVRPDGTSLNISDGICRARHHKGMDAERFVPVDTPTCMSVELNPVAMRIVTGESLRLDIAGSNFPCFDINPQSGAPQGYPSENRKADITIHCGTDHPSKLQLLALQS